MKEIISELTKEGFEAYIVGGYVRDYLLGIPSNDIDIATNAPINKVMKIFKGRGVAFKEYYSFHIKDEDFTYTITTYRKEKEYRRNKPIKLEIASSLGEDLLRRDFTINTFAIDPDGNLIDMLGAKKDLNSRLIKMVGDTDTKLNEDKTRILRAIRLSCTLDFELDYKIVEFIQNHHAHLLNEVSDEYKKKELDKIFDSRNTSRFFYMCFILKLDKYLKIEHANVKEAYDRFGYWAQIETTLPISKKEKHIIENIRHLISKGDISIDDLKLYSDSEVINAAMILGKMDKLRLLKELASMHSIIDIDINIDTMLLYVKINEFKHVYKLIERNIMEGNLRNDKDEIEEFLRLL